MVPTPVLGNSPSPMRPYASFATLPDLFGSLVKKSGGPNDPHRALSGRSEMKPFFRADFFPIRDRAKRFSYPVLVGQTITETVYAGPLRSLEVKVTPSATFDFRGQSRKLFFGDIFSKTCRYSVEACTTQFLRPIRTQGWFIQVNRTTG